MLDPALCEANAQCCARATVQALFRRGDGVHYLGRPTCDEHAYPLGPAPNARVEVVDHIKVAP
jgi:hypothetical protein